MPSRDRRDAAGALHHICFNGNDRRRIILDERDANALALIRSEAALQTNVTILSYADLDTHSHLYVRMSEPNLSLFMQLLLGRYSRAFNKRHDREGHLFQSPFWSRRTTTQPQLLMALGYIALNPVRHGLCAHPREWARGSYRELAGLEDTNAAGSTSPRYSGSSRPVTSRPHGASTSRSSTRGARASTHGNGVRR